MKYQFITLFVVAGLGSCNDDTLSNCKLIEVFESQDYENGGEKLKYEFELDGTQLTKVNKLVFIDGIAHLFYSLAYQYDNQNHVIHIDRKDAQDRLLTYYEFGYGNDLLINFVSRSPTSLSREEREITYDENNKISRVDYSYFKDGETKPFDAFYIMVNHDHAEKAIVNYFDTLDQFAGSIEVINANLFAHEDLAVFMIERYYNSPLYLVDFLPAQMIYKDKEGNIGTTLTYSYTFENGLVKSFELHQGFRKDLFEFGYSCE